MYINRKSVRIGDWKEWAGIIWEGAIVMFVFILFILDSRCR